MRRESAQLFKPALPDDLYINFRVTLDRITFTAIALHPTSTSGAAAAMRGLRERAAGNAGSMIGRTMYEPRPSHPGSGARRGG